MSTYNNLPHFIRQVLEPTFLRRNENKKKDNKKWFCEGTVPGVRYGKIEHCFLIDKLVYETETEFQKVLIFDNSIYGRMLVLDDIVQLSERDSFVYHEMLVHPALFNHPDPKKVLIVGGGDGGTLKEVLKHPVNKVDIVELDPEIIEISKKYLDFLSPKECFQDERVNIYNEKGEDFLAKQKNKYDIIIVDCTDPEPDFEGEKGGKESGYSDPLYSPNFYNLASQSLEKGGIKMLQVGSFLDFESLIKNIYLDIRRVFSYTQMHKVTIPSFHCGEYCFISASNDINLEDIKCEKVRERSQKIKNSLKYYSPEIHCASIMLPPLWQVNKKVSSSKY